MKLLIVGAGTMGRWVADTVDADVAFVDEDESVAGEAATTYDARVVPPSTEEDFDAVCFAVPISVVGTSISKYAPCATDAVFDVTGAMADPVAAMRDHAADRERVSFHPLFAPRNAPGNVACFADESGPLTDGVRGAIADAGNDVFETTVEEHDDAMRTVQSRAHAAVLAYALAADDVREEFATPVSGGLDDLVGTVTDGSSRVYGEIQETFGGADAVADAAERIAETATDAESFAALYDEVAERSHGPDEGGSGDDNGASRNA